MVKLRLTRSKRSHWYQARLRTLPGTKIDNWQQWKRRQLLHPESFFPSQVPLLSLKTNFSTRFTFPAQMYEHNFGCFAAQASDHNPARLRRRLLNNFLRLVLPETEAPVCQSSVSSSRVAVISFSYENCEPSATSSFDSVSNSLR